MSKLKSPPVRAQKSVAKVRDTASLKVRDTLAEFSITPLGAPPSPTGGVSNFVAHITRGIRASGLDNELHSMGTIIEGTLEECLDLIKQSIEATLAAGAPRASVAIKMDVRPGHTGRIRGKVESVQKKLAQK